jgi:hypothetical protein
LNWQDANFNTPAASPFFNYTFARQDGVPSEWWREAFAVVGAITVGGTAWARMSIMGNPASREVGLRRSHLSRPWGSGHEQVTLRLHRLFVWDRRSNRSSA